MKMLIYLCGADRENYRIQCLNSDTGEFQRQIRVEPKDNIGPIYAIEFAPNANGLFKTSIFTRFITFFSLLGSILFAITGGAETPVKKVYMIDARTGDIITSFDSNPVNSNLYDEYVQYFVLFSAFNCST